MPPQTPLQISFRNLAPSEAIEARVRELAERLDRFCDRIISCRVVVELQHRHHHQGNLYHVRIDLRLPGAELVANRESAEHHAHQDVYVAVRDAFDSIRRQIEEHMRRRRSDVKAHVTPPHGRITELDADHGMIETADGRLVYFHRNSVIKSRFADLQLGGEVRFAEEAGELGPQASTVYPVGKHHVVG